MNKIENVKFYSLRDEATYTVSERNERDRDREDEDEAEEAPHGKDVPYSPIRTNCYFEHAICVRSS